MKYKKILRQIAVKENISVKEVEEDMQAAINAAGLKCTAKEFIEITSQKLKKTIYSNNV